MRYAANRPLIERALAHDQKDLTALKATDPKNAQVALLEKRVARMTEFLQPRVTGDGCVQTFMGSPKLDDEQFGAGNARVLVKEQQSRGSAVEGGNPAPNARVWVASA
ncbi:hypothetical protein AB0O28_30645 [Microbispora sp. NPDC088329]|uniref:hypothetical protein n=1 Tax=Microbispora sp. NPDC088329 TaxID=3154869 RepID=UPI0034133EE0